MSNKPDARALIAEARQLAENARDASSRRDGDGDWVKYREFIATSGGPERLLSILDALEAAHAELEVTRPTEDGGCWGSYVDYVARLEAVVAHAELSVTASDAEPDDDEREALAQMFNREYGIGNGTQYWVEFQGNAQHLAKSVLALGFRRRGTNGYQSFGTPATFDQISEALFSTYEHAHMWQAQEKAARFMNRIGAPIVLNREPTEEANRG